MDERRRLAMPAALAARLDRDTPRTLHDQALPLRGLRACRERQGLTQCDLALRTGLPMSLVGLLESTDHAPSPRTWALLARALGVPTACLLDASTLQ
ncbi:MAG: helix-turn-helix protein [Cyanobacteria bacterium RYN_339]|nr:helix-turn-helix protein [Cyanobacteria bacterium RYN_339]